MPLGKVWSGNLKLDIRLPDDKSTRVKRHNCDILVSDFGGVKYAKIKLESIQFVESGSDMALKFSSGNVFKIDNPSEYWCRVSNLVSAHTTMRIDVIRMHQETIPPFGENMYLEFRKVQYFSGWLSWINADFRCADVTEKAQFIRTISSANSDLSDEELVTSSEFGTFALFIAEGKKGKPTHILANAARLCDKDNNTLIEVG